MVSVATASCADRWDYGGYPYGLAPLVLPDPACRLDGGDLSAVEHQLELLETATEDAEVRPESVEQLFWFRWILGNQAAAALWQILDDELDLVLHGEVESAARNAVCLLDGYSVLLIYTCAPTRDLYMRLIRPAMARQHRSFSGRWAQDYIPVMEKLQVLRKVYRARARPEFVDQIIETAKRNHLAHVAVAAKLVPGEESLLRAHDGLASLGEPTDETVALYDAFYSTRRELVPRESIVEQLVFRLRAALRDLRTNGLYPAECDSGHERPAKLWDENLVELEERNAEILRSTAHAAAAALRNGT